MSKKNRKEKSNRIVSPTQYLAKTQGNWDREEARLAKLIAEREERLEREQRESAHLATPMGSRDFDAWIHDRQVRPHVRVKAHSTPVYTPRVDRRIYFAYGSNLLESQMRHRCPGATKLYPHELPGFKLEFQRYANIVEGAETDSVPGFMWLIHPEDEQWLDKFEGVGSGSYHKKTFKFFTPRGNWRDVLYYQKPKGRLIPPSGDYLEKIAAGYARFGFPLNKLGDAVSEAKEADKIYQQAIKAKQVEAEPLPFDTSVVDEDGVLDGMALNEFTLKDLEIIAQDPSWKITREERRALRRVIRQLKEEQGE